MENQTSQSKVTVQGHIVIYTFLEHRPHSLRTLHINQHTHTNTQCANPHHKQCIAWHGESSDERHQLLYLHVSSTAWRKGKPVCGLLTRDFTKSTLADDIPPPPSSFSKVESNLINEDELVLHCSHLQLQDSWKHS